MSAAVPQWLQETVRAFGESLGLAHLALNGVGAAALHFDSGLTLRLEYAYEGLSVVAAVPTRGETEAIKRLLGYAYPALQGDYPVRTAYAAKKGEAVMMVRLAASEVTLPALNGAVQALWRLVEDFRNRERV